MYKIGFSVKEEQRCAGDVLPPPGYEVENVTPRKSLVRVAFIGTSRAYTYFNDKFDLKVGDLVYVEGAMEGCRGRVEEISYCFKIKLSDYKRVIFVADTEVHGHFYNAPSQFITFNRNAIPFDRVKYWYRAPDGEEDVFVSSEGGEAFLLSDLKGMKIAPDIAERGHDYYMNDKVRYICIDKNCGYAIVEGRKPYEIEFEYRDGEIKNLTCSCYCSGSCKHSFAAMLNLREIIEIIEKKYAKDFESTGYFAAINRSDLFGLSVCGKEDASFVF